MVKPDGTAGDANGDGDVNDTDRGLLEPTDLVERAHERGLLVHPYTFRNEQGRLASDYEGNPVNEYLRFYEIRRGRRVLGLPEHRFRGAGAVLAAERRVG